MIRPKRILHRLAWICLGIGLPILFVASINARKPVPADESFNLASGDAKPFASVQFTLLDGAVNAHVSRSVSGERTLHLVAGAPLSLPSVLVYQARGGVDEGLLLGSFGGEVARAYPLTEAGEAGAGDIVLYDLGHHVELDRVPVPPREGGP